MGMDNGYAIYHIYALITSFIVAITSIFPIRTLLKQADELFFYHLNST